MGYGDFQYYGLMDDGKYGWSGDTSTFKPGGITGASQSGFLGNTMYGNGVDAPNSGLLGSGRGIGENILGGYDSKGMYTPGWGQLGLGAFSAWNNWSQGNKMYDLQKDALDFSQNKFWLDYMNKIEDKNQFKNTRNMQLARRDQVVADPSLVGDSKSISDNSLRFNTGEYVVPYGAETGTPIAAPGSGSKYINPAYGNQNYSNPAYNNATNSAFAQPGPTVARAAVPTAPTAPSVKSARPAALKQYRDRNIV